MFDDLVRISGSHTTSWARQQKARATNGVAQAFCQSVLGILGSTHEAVIMPEVPVTEAFTVSVAVMV